MGWRMTPKGELIFLQEITLPCTTVQLQLCPRVRVPSAVLALFLFGCAHGVDDASVLSALRTTGAGGAGGQADPMPDAAGGAGGTGATGGNVGDASGGSDGSGTVDRDATGAPEADAMPASDGDAMTPGFDAAPGDGTLADAPRIDANTNADAAPGDASANDGAAEAACVGETDAVSRRAPTAERAPPRKPAEAPGSRTSVDRRSAWRAAAP
jgi:hypothetical protein